MGIRSGLLCPGAGLEVVTQLSVTSPQEEGWDGPSQNADLSVRAASTCLWEPLCGHTSGDTPGA